MGIWVIDWIYLRDVVKNHITFQTTELISLGFPVELEVTDNQPPVADAGKDITVEATSTSGAQIILDGSASSDPDGDMMIYTWRESGNVIAGPTIQPKSTVVLALGTHTIELTVDDGNGETDTDEVIWNVVDTTPPELSVSLDPDVLWPPNHKMVNITASVEVSDLCDEDAAFVLTSISSSEPDDTPGNGDGNTVNDIQEVDIGTSDTQFQLRAERMGNGDGRFYSVEYTVSDASGNSKKVIETVNVPHDKKGLEKEMISSISEIVPETLCLNQNYPNPFNPITFIQYGIPEATQVKLEVYNTLGQRIRTLIDHHQEAGVYSVEWNGRDDRGELTSSGIYFYLLRAGDKLISNKMMKVE